jgi:hypothetical protein
MTATGLAQTGPISEGSLPQGADARIGMRLEAGSCYTIVALGSTQVRDLDVQVLDETGEEIGRDATHDRQAAAQACPEQSGEYQVVVAMAGGHGSYMLTAWSGAPRRGATASTAGGPTGRGSCEEPLALEIGQPTDGSTSQGQARMNGSCVSGGAPEQVYRFTLEQRSQFSAVLQSTYDGALYLQRSCGQQQSEITCNDDNPNTRRSQIDATLEAGTYFLVVDGYGSDAGNYDLIVSTNPLQPIADVCRAAPPLSVGQPVTGTTQGQANQFSATCAGGARSPDRVYRMQVAARSRVRIRQQSDHDGAVYIRRTCADPTTEVACNDDFRDQRHSLVTAVLDPGRYFVFTDGFSSNNAGNYMIHTELAPAAGGGATADACAGPGTANPGQAIEIDTFQAQDDASGTCGGQGAPDVVYSVNVRSRSRLRATLEDSEILGAMYVQRTCGDASTEVACTAVTHGVRSGALDTVLQAGQYFLVVDGQRADTFGSARLTVQLDDLAALERTCRAAPLLRRGRTTSGSTLGSSDRFQASCAGGAQSNDQVYRIRLRRRSRVRVRMSSAYDGALHLRRDCTDPSTEIACNDDENDNRHSFIESTLDAGMYYLIVDGFRSSNNGTYDINLEVSAP